MNTLYAMQFFILFVIASCTVKTMVNYNTNGKINGIHRKPQLFSLLFIILNFNRTLVWFAPCFAFKMVLQMVLICTFRTGLFMITVHGRYMFKSRYSARLKRLLFTVLLCFLRGLYTLDKKKLKLFYDLIIFQWVHFLS